jgi:hypothetical protein
MHLEDEVPATLNWDLDSERFGLGDEFSDDRRQWTGTIYQVEVFTCALDDTEVRARFEAGPRT